MTTTKNTAVNYTFYIFLLYLSLLSMLGFIATDMYLPAFKAIESSLDATTSQVAFSLTSFLAGLALGQFLYGPLVHHWGKRRALVFGLSVFALSSLVIAISDNILLFNAARFFQAIGACSAGVIWQAIVIERYDAKRAQGIFSNIMPLVALSPALAPILGAYVLAVLGWEAIFISLSAIAVSLILLTVYFVPKPITDNSEPSSDAVSYKALFGNTHYIGSVVIFGACSGAFFAYLTLWPVVMAQHGYDADAIGLSFIPQTIMFMVGGFASKKLITILGSEKALNVLLVQFGVCVAAIVLFSIVIKVDSIYPLLISFSIMASANGAIYPIVVNNALQQFKQNATKAVGLQNFLQISIAFGASSLVALWAQSGEVAIAWGILGCALLVCAGYRLQKSHDWDEINGCFTTPDPARLSHCDDFEGK
ncbi:purine nucleoside transporter PunC [Shewanella acanthi]|uniref:purine nucleoside transporter PunC n=1 Tax=Shewanella acanthi TaxID=2864212 RepID=UPI001C6573E0|nr:purine nucleoside transporter PunC [Shewanella acanthi]QYJ77402.1 Bcr/CflA family multidrug efflux MFS transporter [Shewanella acanthi]